VTALLVGLVVEFVLTMPPGPTAIAISGKPGLGMSMMARPWMRARAGLPLVHTPLGVGQSRTSVKDTGCYHSIRWNVLFLFSSATRTTGTGNLRKFVRRTNISKFV
jgi:hypothetical protein